MYQDVDLFRLIMYDVAACKNITKMEGMVLQRFVELDSDLLCDQPSQLRGRDGRAR